MVNEHWLQLKVTFSCMLAALGPNRRVSLSFEALKTGIDFSLAMKTLDGILFHYEVVLSTLKTCYLVESPSLIILAGFSGNLATASTLALAASPCTFML